MSAVALDFRDKSSQRLEVGGVPAAVERGCFCWVDLDLRSCAATDLDVLVQGGLCPADVIEHARQGDPAIQWARHEQGIQMDLVGCHLAESGLAVEGLTVFVSKHAMVTLHMGEPAFLREVQREFLTDFVRHAATPSFLVFELWDHLLDNYARIQKSFEDRVMQIQRTLAVDPDESLFHDASGLGVDLLQFRKVMLPARTVLTDLSTRKSTFVSEATQAFLANMVGTVERILNDVIVDREILSDALNGHMSMVAHNTNRVMSKLTVVTVIFLPLTFLCGVYGMNFEVLPELKWEWGYAGFWGTALTIVAALLLFMRRKRIL